MRTGAAWLAIVALAATTVGCSRDAEVLAFAHEFETFSGEIVKKVKSAPNPTAGVEAAQAYLDQNRESLRAKTQGVKTVRGFQLSAEAKKTLETSMIQGASAVAGLQLEYVTQMALNAAFRSKLEKLVTDYRNLVSE